MGLFSRKKAETAVPEANAAADTAAGTGAAAPDTVNEEMIAVISAAIAAYEAEQFTQTLYIQKINRACGVRPVWGVIGTQEAIDVRRM